MGEQGFVLLTAITLMAVMLSIAATSVYMASRNARSADTSADRMAAEGLAEAGLSYARSILAVSGGPIEPRQLRLSTGVATYRAEAVLHGWALTSVGVTNRGTRAVVRDIENVYSSIATP